jgi:hypothetical protein
MPLSEREDYIDQILGLLDTASATDALMAQIKKRGKTPKGIHLKPNREPVVSGERASDMYVTRSVRGDAPGKPWRVSYFKKGKPLGHSNHTTLEKVLRFVDRMATGFTMKALREALAERRGDWLFHTTNPVVARMILDQGKLLGAPFASLSSTATFHGEVVFVFKPSRMRDRFMPVEYTQEWAVEHPKHAAYIVEKPDAAFGKGVGNAMERWMRLFTAYSHEREWISKSSGAIPIKPGDLDRILVVAPVPTDVDVQGFAAVLHPRQARELLAKLPRKTAERAALMMDLKKLAKLSGLLAPDDVMWRDRGRNVRTKEREKLKDLKLMAADPYGLNIVDELLATLAEAKTARTAMPRGVVLSEGSTEPESLAIRKTAHLNPKRGQARLFKWKKGQRPHIKRPYSRAVVALGIDRDIWWSPDVGVHAILYDELALQGKVQDRGMQGIHYFITYDGELLLS